VATLAVLVAAVIEGPKIMRGGAAAAQGVPASVGTPAPLTPAVPTTPAATPETAPAPRAAVVPAAAATPVPASLLSTRPVQQPVPAQYAFRPAQPPVQFARPDQAAPTPTATTSPAVTAATASPEMKELRDRINRVAIRAAAAQASVHSIEQGVQWQGLGLRGDIKAASIRLNYVLQEARASLQNGDVEGARNNLQYAEGTLQKIEKFLGQ